MGVISAQNQYVIVVVALASINYTFNILEQTAPPLEMEFKVIVTNLMDIKKNWDSHQQSENDEELDKILDSIDINLINIVKLLNKVLSN